MSLRPRACFQALLPTLPLCLHNRMAGQPGTHVNTHVSFFVFFFCALPCDICHNSQGIHSSLLLLIPLLLTHASVTHSTFQLLQGNLHVFADTNGVRAHEVSFSLTNAAVSSAASGSPSFVPFHPSMCNSSTTRVSAM